MPSESTRPWAYLGLGAAALFAIGSVAAVAIASDLRAVAAQSAGNSSSVLQERYVAATRTLDAWEAQQREAQCELDARIVGAVGLEERMRGALDDAAIVQDANLIIDRPQRAEFEQSRASLVEAFAEGFTTDGDRAVADLYGGEQDVAAVCLAQSETSTQPAAGPVTLAVVEELEARAASLDDPSAPDVARLDALDQAVVELAQAVLRAADAVVGVERLEATAEALRVAVEPLRGEASPAQAVDALAALTAHAQAALDRQAEIAEEEAAQEAAESDPPPSDPDPAPAPEPAPEPTPEPTQPGGGGGGGSGGDSPIDPLVP